MVGSIQEIENKYIKALHFNGITNYGGTTTISLQNNISLYIHRFTQLLSKKKFNVITMF